MTRVGVMQPYFFPYLGHFGLIANIDEWIVFDVTQYTPKKWINRNRVLHPSGGWNYITVPLANSSVSIKMHEALVLDPGAARRSVLGKISHYTHNAPYFEAVVDLVEEAFSDTSHRSIVHLDVRALSAVCRYLELPFRFRILSELGLELPNNPGAGRWALTVCERIGATSYLSPVGGRALFDPDDYARLGIELLFAETEPLRYTTGPFQFEPALSILDVLMWNDPRQVKEWLMTRTRVIR